MVVRTIVLILTFGMNFAYSQETVVPERQIRTKENSYYGQILNRTNNVISGYERATNAHENIHMINSDYSNKTMGKKRAFYITGEQRVFYTKNPRMLKNDVRSFIPQSLRGTRYKTYLEGAQDWNDVPLYIMDEWVAYIGGGMVALQDYENKTARDQSDRMCGALEFSIYTVALCMAIEKKDPTFWEQEEEFRKFVAKMLDQSQSLFYKGRYIDDFKSSSQERLLTNLQTSQDAQAMRDFIKKWFNGAFVK